MTGLARRMLCGVAMRRWHILTLLVLLGSASAAYACSLAPEASPGEVLGYAQYVPADSAGGVLPANVAGRVDVGESFVSEGIEFFRYPEGTRTVDVGGTSIEVGTTADTTPPSTPIVRDANLSASGSGCGAYTCGRIQTFHFDIEATDDVAPNERLTYAIYLADAPGRFVPEPDHLLVRDNGDIWAFGNDDDEGATTYVQVRAIDQAGNVSALSEPFLVDTGEGGCSAAARPRAGLGIPVLFALLWLRRRRTR